MFEKEAKERARTLEKRQTLGVYDNDEDLARDIAWDEGKVAGYEDGFKDGAEFGYNKANEWHYVKDGEYPTHSNRVLVFTDEGVGFGLYGLDNKKWYTYDTGFDVIAWQEIVLPKEIKEND